MGTIKAAIAPSSDFIQQLSCNIRNIKQHEILIKNILLYNHDYIITAI